MKIERVRGRSGRVESYDERKVTAAIYRAATEARAGRGDGAEPYNGEDAALAEELGAVVTLFLEKQFGGGEPEVDDVQDMVEKVLLETGRVHAARAFVARRERSERRRRRLRVVPERQEGLFADDAPLTVDGVNAARPEPWNRERITTALVREADLAAATAAAIAGAVERKILDSGLERVSTTLIRELVDAELLDRGMADHVARQQVLGVPSYDLEGLLFGRAASAGGTTTDGDSSSPARVERAIARRSLLGFLPRQAFSAAVLDAHRAGRIHILDAGEPGRLRGMRLPVSSFSAGAPDARALTSRIARRVAGCIGLVTARLEISELVPAYVPLLAGAGAQAVRREAVELIQALAAVERAAGVSVGLELELELELYGSIQRQREKQKQIKRGAPDGDRDAQFAAAAAAELADQACADQPALLQPLFTFGPDDVADVLVGGEGSPDRRELLDACCRAARCGGASLQFVRAGRDAVAEAPAPSDIVAEAPAPSDIVTDIVAATVVVNVARCAYRAGAGGVEALQDELSEACELAVRALAERRSLLARLAARPGRPLHAAVSAGGTDPALDLAGARYTVALCGLGEALHSNVFALGVPAGEIAPEAVRCCGHVQRTLRELGRDQGMLLSLDGQGVDDAVARRLARSDREQHPESGVALPRTRSHADWLYSSGLTLPDAAAPEDAGQMPLWPLLDDGAESSPDIERQLRRAAAEGELHRFADAAQTTLFLDSAWLTAERLAALIGRLLRETQLCRVRFVTEFVTCARCGHRTPGRSRTCARCGSGDTP